GLGLSAIGLDIVSTFRKMSTKADQVHCRTNDGYDGGAVNRLWHLAWTGFIEHDGSDGDWDPIPESALVLRARASRGGAFPRLAASGHRRALSAIDRHVDVVAHFQPGPCPKPWYHVVGFSESVSVW